MEVSCDRPVAVEGLVKKYGDEFGVRGVSLRVDKGEIASVLGPNGAGKSTLIKLVAGVLNPTSGSVKVCGHDPRSHHARKFLGYMPQTGGLYEDMTGWENLMFFGGLKGLSGASLRRESEELLKLVNLYDARNKLVRKYSGGMKRRLSLAIALLGSPGVVVVDEPTSGLDPDVRIRVWEALKRLREEGKAVVMATHFIDEAERLSDKVYVMDYGKVVASGTPHELIRKYVPEAVITVEVSGKASECAGALKRFEGEWIVTIGGERRIYVYTHNPDSSLPEIVSTLHRFGCVIIAVRVRKPTLEDVFFKLTGRGFES